VEDTPSTAWLSPMPAAASTFFASASTSSVELITPGVLQHSSQTPAQEHCETAVMADKRSAGGGAGGGANKKRKYHVCPRSLPPIQKPPPASAEARGGVLTT
jgi:hypothetical protein